MENTARGFRPEGSWGKTWAAAQFMRAFHVRRPTKAGDYRQEPVRTVPEFSGIASFPE